MDVDINFTKLGCFKNGKKLMTNSPVFTWYGKISFYLFLFYDDIEEFISKR